MIIPVNTLLHLENKSAHLTVDLYGGAITNFHLKENTINPLSFLFCKEQMPANNRNGAPYQGHFLCLGRWGLPSGGEIQKGIPNHGEAANVLWYATSQDEHSLEMQADTQLEGLHVKRILHLDKHQPIFVVRETVQNINPLGRMYNMVQHPTLAAPFLTNDTIVDCNASIGFDQALYKHANQNRLHWSSAIDAARNNIDLRSPKIAYNSVFSFIVQPDAEYGWITAYSPVHQLLIGYAWKRSDYPWIHVWQHWNENTIQYRGIEFGTAGIHQPFEEIIDTAVELFGEKTVAYIDAGEAVSKSYVCFLQQTATDFTGVEEIKISHEYLIIKQKGNNNITIKLTSAILHELS